MKTNLASEADDNRQKDDAQDRGPWILIACVNLGLCVHGTLCYPAAPRGTLGHPAAPNAKNQAVHPYFGLFEAVHACFGPLEAFGGSWWPLDAPRCSSMLLDAARCCSMLLDAARFCSKLLESPPGPGTLARMPISLSRACSKGALEAPRCCSMLLDARSCSKLLDSSLGCFGMSLAPGWESGVFFVWGCISLPIQARKPVFLAPDV